MPGITTHILDLSKGAPAAHVEVALDFLSDNTWQQIAIGKTNSDGRIPDLLQSAPPLAAGTYRLTFHTALYFAAQYIDTFYPQIEIQFFLKNPAQHHHVPLLLSPFGYSTYRGS